jgi:hypothetical protein
MARRFMSELREELSFLEDEELDMIRSFLVYTLIKNTSLEMDDIYSCVYSDGKKILWN